MISLCDIPCHVQAPATRTFAYLGIHTQFVQLLRIKAFKGVYPADGLTRPFDTMLMNDKQCVRAACVGIEWQLHVWVSSASFMSWPRHPQDVPPRHPQDMPHVAKLQEDETHKICP